MGMRNTLIVNGEESDENPQVIAVLIHPRKNNIICFFIKGNVIAGYRTTRGFPFPLTDYSRQGGHK